VDNIFFALVMSMSTMSIWYNGMADKNDYTGEGEGKIYQKLEGNDLYGLRRNKILLLIKELIHNRTC